jgi:uncharacterized membrane protein YgdD (TMEM256/DUF423 family)
MRWTLIAAGLLGVVGVATGAFAAHGLEGWLQRQLVESEELQKRIQQCDVAVRYHLLHALALLALGVGATFQGRLMHAAGLFWVLGVCLFSGGLYSMVFLGAMGHWAIVPSGGLCFILGWTMILIQGLLKRNA